VEVDWHGHTEDSESRGVAHAKGFPVPQSIARNEANSGRQAVTVHEEFARDEARIHAGEGCA